jgi:hypothetical protein
MLSSSQTRYFSSKSASRTFSDIRTHAMREAACAATEAKPTGSAGERSRATQASVSSPTVSGTTRGSNGGSPSGGSFPKIRTRSAWS